MDLQVLVATMKQNDFSKLKEMNIQSDVVFANQANLMDRKEYKFNGYKAVMISTKTRGVGINRNIAIMASTADILLFADDDITYNDGYEKEVINAFKRWPHADIICFNMCFTKNGKIVGCKHNQNKRLHIYNALRHGAASIAVKRESIIKSNIYFSSLFGGGCLYGSGEDSLFIVQCFEKGLNIYSSSYVLGRCSQDSSTWFTGYNDKYFYDKGAWAACAFPKLKYLVALYLLFRHRKMICLPLIKTLNMILLGIEGYKNLRSYDEMVAKNSNLK